jgi:exopolysaccharide production protein ExoQ
MQQLILNPAILLLILSIFIIIYFILFSITKRQKIRLKFDELFIMLFLAIVSGTIVPPFKYLNPTSLGIADLKFTSLTFIAQVVLYPAVFFLLRGRLRDIYPIFKALLKSPFLCGLLLITVLSAFWSQTPGFTLKYSLILLGLSVLATSVAMRYDIFAIARILRWTGTAISGCGTFASLFVPSIGRLEAAGWNGILSHKNGFSCWIALTACLWFLQAVTDRSKRWYSLILSIACFIAMMCAGSGAARVLFVVTMGVLIFSKLLQRLDFRKTFTALLFAIIMAIPSFLFVWANKQYILGALGKDATLTGRTEFWPQVIEAIWQQPIVGYGYQGFWQAWRGADNPAARIINPNGFVPPHSHNGFLEIVLALGAIGIVLFACSLLIDITRICALVPYLSQAESGTILAILIFITISNFSEAGLWGIGHHTFLYVFLSVRLPLELKNIKSIDYRTENIGYSSTI